MGGSLTHTHTHTHTHLQNPVSRCQLYYGPITLSSQRGPWSLFSFASFSVMHPLLFPCFVSPSPIPDFCRAHVVHPSTPFIVTCLPCLSVSVYFLPSPCRLYFPLLLLLVLLLWCVLFCSMFLLFSKPWLLKQKTIQECKYVNQQQRNHQTYLSSLMLQAHQHCWCQPISGHSWEKAYSWIFLPNSPSEVSSNNCPSEVSSNNCTSKVNGEDLTTTCYKRPFCDLFWCGFPLFEVYCVAN